MFNKIILLAMCILPTYGADSDDELSYSNEHAQQINYFIEKIHSRSTKPAYQKFVGWVVQWGPCVDFEA